MKKIIVVILAIIVLLPTHSASADWARSFVVFSDDIYEITDEIIPSDKVEKKIGHVTKYSDHEGTYTGNFSNTFPKGTSYYSIKNTDPDQLIAIESQEDIFIKAINKGHYPNDQLERQMFWIYLFGFLCAFLLIIWIIGIIRRHT